MNVTGEMLRSFRVGKHVKQADLAKDLKVNQSTLSRLEMSASLPFNIIMALHKVYGDEWFSWIKQPFFASQKEPIIPGFLQIPVVSEVTTESFEFAFDMFPREVIYLGTRVAGLKLNMDIAGARHGDYLIVSETDKVPANCWGVVKTGLAATVKKIDPGDSLSVLGIVMGSFRKLV